jgi:hemerythrin-like metal-binding protein
MDDQHGILMDSLNELRTSLSQGADPAAVREVLTRITALTTMHFEAEEALMTRFAYPGLEEHRAEHQKLLAQLTDYANHPNSTRAGSEGALVEFLRNWFIEHVEGMDQKYGPWMNERGVR